MTLTEIRARIQEIDARRAQIAQESTNPEAPLETLESLSTELTGLTEERASLVRQDISLRAGAQVQPVIPTNPTPAPTPAVPAPLSQRGIRDLFGTEEYRNAFQDYIANGVMSEVLTRANASTTTSGISSVIIPTTITDRLFESNDLAGSIFERVTKTNYAAGIEVAISDFKPVLYWVAENGKSDRQKATTGKISFFGYKGEIRVAISLEAQTMSLAQFEARFTAQITEACKLGFDKAIVAGSGSGCPKGILTDATYTTGTGCNAVSMSTAQITDYSYWFKIWAKIPAKKKSKSCLHINDCDWRAYISGMKDENGRVVAVDLVGEFGSVPRAYFMGMPVVLMEDQGLSTFDNVVGSSTMSKSTAFAYFFDDKDYFFNSNLQLRLSKYIDHESDETVHKATVIADGKPVDKSSLLVVCKAAA